MRHEARTKRTYHKPTPTNPHQQSRSILNAKQEETHNSLRKAKDQPSVFRATSSAIWSADFSKTTPWPFAAVAPMLSTLRIHRVANALRSSYSGSVKLYFTSKREGRFNMASSIRSGWLVVAMVKIPSFWAYGGYSSVEEADVLKIILTNPSSSFNKKLLTLGVTIESRSSRMRIQGECFLA